MLEEEFSETHHKIVDCLGTLFSSLKENSGIMALIMSWADTQNSINTLSMMEDYIKKYINIEPLSQ